MAERFGYYSMRAIFVLYLIKALLIDKDVTSTIYGNYRGLVYLAPLIGGYVADKYWGMRRSIFLGAVMMVVGQLLMFMSALCFQQLQLAKILMFTGLGALIMGNGFIKSNISSCISGLYIRKLLHLMFG